MIKIGDFEIHLINDCTIMADAGGPFGLVPRSLWQNLYIPPNQDNQVPMVTICLLVKTAGKIILIDTGHGDKLPRRMQQLTHMNGTGGLLRGLAELNIQPEAIDIVIDTHLHGDHAGGNTRFVEGDTKEVTASFPNATYFVHAREYEDALKPNERTRATYHLHNYQPLVESGQMQLLTDQLNEIIPGITTVLAPGHTPGHMAVRFESQGQHAAFLCDLASFSIHFERLAWMTAYDVEPLITLETKRIWQQWALETQATLIFPHDAQRPVARLIQNSGKPYLENIDTHIINGMMLPES
ncbi:MBL fold metallo-hydrolase [Anaerolineales bacterium]